MTMRVFAMEPMRLAAVAVLTGVLGCGAVMAQEPNPTADPQTARVGAKFEGTVNGVPLYRVNVVQRDLDAVNYFHRSGSTKIAFVGTTLAPSVRGEAKVQSEKGSIAIDLHLDGLSPANGFGNEYLTYVLWAITPDGTPANLGEVLPDGHKVDLKATTNLQSFGLIVTAEPYYAVKVPSDVVIAQNQILEDKTTGVLEKVNAHYTLLPRGLYSQTNGSKTVLDPITRNEKSPLELYEAHNAFNIARLAGAEQDAPDILAKVQEDLRNADDIDRNKKGDQKLEITYAREAVERSEDARIESIRKQVARERQAEVDARQAAQLQAAASQQQAAASQLQAQQSALDAERAQAAADRAAAERANAEAQAANANAAAAAAQAQANAAKQDVVALREKLRAQLNAVLATQETARGLVVTLGDVLFDTGKSALKQNAQISLAKVSAILQQYPDLKLQIAGYTDSTGSDALNLKLSNDRAKSTEDFLAAQGVQGANMTYYGFGKQDPVADNTSATGRAQNRRVELIVSGPSIGVQTQELAPQPGAVN